MIENIEQFRQLVEDTIGGKCYLEYPQDRITKDRPFAVISMVGNTPLQNDYDHSEVMAVIAYNIHLYAKKQTELMDYVSKVSDAFAKFNFTRVALTSQWNHPTHGPYRILTVQGIIDRRGNTFTYM